MAAADTIAHLLAPLASRHFQDRYIVNATPQRYVVPDQLVDDADHVVTSVNGEAEWTSDLTPEQRQAVLDLGTLLDDALDAYDPAAEWAQLIESEPAWARLREGAGHVVAAMGLDLAAWEKER